MRVLLIMMVAVISAPAQSPLVRIVNTSHPGMRDFQVGDQFEILITGPPNQPISVRTTMHGRTDWGPVIASTDDTGRWSTNGRFDKTDFGGWSEIWTVGGKLASPAIRFLVGAPCLPGGRAQQGGSGPNLFVSCETAQGSHTFVTPSLSDAFRTPDGRIVPGRTPQNMTPDEYHMEILQDFIVSDGKDIGTASISLSSSAGGLGDETAGLITRLIGVNALSEAEIRNVLTILRGVFEKPESIAPSARTPSRTMALLGHLADVADQNGVKQQIGETIAYVQNR